MEWQGATAFDVHQGSRPAVPWRHLDPDATGFSPHTLIAHAFAPVGAGRSLWAGFPNQDQTLPERRDGRAALTFSADALDRTTTASLIDRWVALAGRTLAGLRQSAGATSTSWF